MIEYNLPTISIITGTFNSDISIFKRILDSIKVQHYPADLIKHLVMDGGSTNWCVELAKRYGSKVVIGSDSPDKEQDRPALGIYYPYYRKH